jgi:hypothetical protein
LWPALLTENIDDFHGNGCSNSFARAIRCVWKPFTIFLATKFEVRIDKFWHLDVPMVRLDFYTITAIAIIDSPPMANNVNMSVAKN